MDQGILEQAWSFCFWWIGCDSWVILWQTHLEWEDEIKSHSRLTRSTAFTPIPYINLYMYYLLTLGFVPKLKNRNHLYFLVCLYGMSRLFWEQTHSKPDHLNNQTLVKAWLMGPNPSVEDQWARLSSTLRDLVQNMIVVDVEKNTQKIYYSCKSISLQYCKLQIIIFH